MAKLSVSCVYANFPYLRIFCLRILFVQTSQESVYNCLVIILWKCEYCLTWALNNSVLFGSNSLKMSVLMEALEICAVLLAINFLKILVLFDMNSAKACSIACQ